MTHDEIAAANMVECYLTGKLSPDESARFEEHYVDCPDCLEQLEAAERFRVALKPWADEAGGAALVPGGRRNWPVGWLVAAAVVLAAGASIVLGIRDAALRQELQRARTASADWQRRYEAERAAAEAVPSTALVASTFYLTVTRGGDLNSSEPINRVTVPAALKWVVLSLEGKVEAGFQSLRTGVADSAGTNVWSQSGLQVTPHESLSVILPSFVLHSGDYVLTLEGLTTGGRYVTAGRYRFRVTSR